ncbi:unnamed protein product [Urochloa decumbens]|uniref:Plant heme peroxidase family profile domain-containing protein n=1 Tax=Urochloa decumbens TaxID=240449 RepID=A0ABC9GBI8_9POAL
MAVRDTIVLTGGPSNAVELGRRDELSSLPSNVDRKLAPLSFNFDQLAALFAANGLEMNDMVTLSARHTGGYRRMGNAEHLLRNATSTSFVHHLKDLWKSPRGTVLRIEALALVAIILTFLLAAFGSCRRWSNRWILQKGFLAANALFMSLGIYIIGLMQSSPVKSEMYPIWCVSFLTLFGCVDSIAACNLDQKSQLWKMLYQLCLYCGYVLLMSITTVSNDVGNIAICTLSAITFIKGFHMSLALVLPSRQRNMLRMIENPMEHNFFRLYCDYRKKESLDSYKYVVHWPLDENEPNSNEVPWTWEWSNNGVITIDMIWRCSGKLPSYFWQCNGKLHFYVRRCSAKLSSYIWGCYPAETSSSDSNRRKGLHFDACKDLCLSFSLCHLLQRRFFGLKYVGHTSAFGSKCVGLGNANAYETEDSKDVQFSWLLLERDGITGYEWAFKVIEVELAFLYDVFYTSNAFLHYYQAKAASIWACASIIGICFVGVAAVIPGTRSTRRSSGATIVVDTTTADIIITLVILSFLTLLQVLQLIRCWTSNWARVAFACDFVRNQQNFHQKKNARCDDHSSEENVICDNHPEENASNGQAIMSPQSNSELAASWWRRQKIIRLVQTFAALPALGKLFRQSNSESCQLNNSTGNFFSGNCNEAAPTIDEEEDDLGVASSWRLRLKALLTRINWFEKYLWQNKLGQYSLVESISTRECKLVRAFFRWRLSRMLGWRYIEQVCREMWGSNTGDVVELHADVKEAIARVNPRVPIADDYTYNILLWHIATCYCELVERKKGSLFCQEPTAEGSNGEMLSPKSREEIEKKYRVATALSKYCAYLFVSAPQLLPGQYMKTKSLYEAVVQDARTLLHGAKDKLEAMRRAECEHREEGRPGTDAFLTGVRMGKYFQDMSDVSQRWEELADLWVAALVYAAPSDSVEEHVRHLSMGGEFITHLWAFLSHAGILKWETTGPSEWPGSPPGLYY